MTVICPTITAETKDTYDQQVSQIEDFANRLHIDVMDGVFTPNKSVDLDQVWWPNHITADVHMMYQRPMDYIDKLIELKPNMVIVQAESDCNFAKFAKQLNDSNIKAGLSLLANTSVDEASNVLKYFQQVLIFSGNLGYQGGSVADFGLFNKVNEVKSVHPEVLEIAWDGGVNEQNIKQIAEAGVSVINVGGAIQKSGSPKGSYDSLMERLK